MSQGVTYADLRFVRSPLEKSQPEGSEPPQGSPPRCLLTPSPLPEAGHDGELTYENIQGPRAQEEKALGSPKGTPGSDRRTWYAAVAVLGTCLFLLATTIGLGVRTWKVSQQLQQASHEHVAESSILTQRIEAKEGSLAQTQLRLDQAEAELSSTRLALHESWAAGNETLQQLQLREDSLRRMSDNLARVSQEKGEQLRQLEGKLREAADTLAREQQVREKTEADLRQATSCQQMGCCPDGWKLFRWKCLWISTDQKTWADSKASCKSEQSQLLILKPWSARELWDAVLVNYAQHYPQSYGYWIGLNKTWPSKFTSKYILLWDDGSRYEGTEKPLGNYYDDFIKIHNGALEYGWRNTLQQYICEKAANSIQPS
ncbi:B-cell differentiation antigen CD72-like [Elgaria multicarinata webbii]|uniref:B-cell differentiation antigen CD72-like n=1 Tax=Elgaria multicarinata webbii TaxID=159646 RepID=UPI002FCCC87E